MFQFCAWRHDHHAEYYRMVLYRRLFTSKETMKPFGTGSLSHTHGFDLRLLVGHLEGLKDHELHSLPIKYTKTTKRFELVLEACIILEQALELEPGE